MGTQHAGGSGAGILVCHPTIKRNILTILRKNIYFTEVTNKLSKYFGKLERPKH